MWRPHILILFINNWPKRTLLRSYGWVLYPKIHSFSSHFPSLNPFNFSSLLSLFFTDAHCNIGWPHAASVLFCYFFLRRCTQCELFVYKLCGISCLLVINYTSGKIKKLSIYVFWSMTLWLNIVLELKLCSLRPWKIVSFFHFGVSMKNSNVTNGDFLILHPLFLLLSLTLSISH